MKLEDDDCLVEGLKALIETIVHENVSLVISRQLLSEISCHVPKLSDEIGKAVCSFALGKIQPRVISFEEQVATVRQHLADIYEREQCWKEAANVLVGIPLETGQKLVFFYMNSLESKLSGSIYVCRQYSLDYKLETYLKIARLYLEDDDPVQAESFINRASLLQVANSL